MDYDLDFVDVIVIYNNNFFVEVIDNNFFDGDGVKRIEFEYNMEEEEEGLFSVRVEEVDILVLGFLGLSIKEKLLFDEVLDLDMVKLVLSLFDEVLGLDVVKLVLVLFDEILDLDVIKLVFSCFFELSI